VNIACEVHPAGETAPPSFKKFDGKWWCRTCFDALKKQIKARAKARGLPSNRIFVAFAMSKVGANGNRPPPDASRLLKGAGKEPEP
jgi:hypothetical protein